MKLEILEILDKSVVMLLKQNNLPNSNIYDTEAAGQSNMVFSLNTEPGTIKKDKDIESNPNW